MRWERKAHDVGFDLRMAKFDLATYEEDNKKQDTKINQQAALILNLRLQLARQGRMLARQKVRLP